MLVPCSCTRTRTLGSVEGSSRKVVKASGLVSRAVWTGGRRWGRVERVSPQYWRVLARVGASAAQAPERRWGRSPLVEVQEGRRQAPDSPVQCLWSQSVLYRPLIIRAWTVAARTAVAEEPQVVHRGWAPEPRGIKEGRRNWRLGRASASATSLLRQYVVTARRTAAFQAGLEAGGEVRVTRGSVREYWKVSSLTWVNFECCTPWCRM